MTNKDLQLIDDSLNLLLDKEYSWIVFDESVFLDENSNFFMRIWPRLALKLEAAGKQILLPNEAYQKIKNLATQSTKLAYHVTREITRCAVAKGPKNVIRVCGDNNHVSINERILLIAKMYLNQRAGIFVTQEPSVACDLMNHTQVNNYKYQASIMTFSASGILTRFSRLFSSFMSPKRQIFKFCDQKASSSTFKFKTSKKVTEPRNGDIFYTKDKTCVVIQKPFAHGGEGWICSTNTPDVAKIYKKREKAGAQAEKLTLFADKRAQPIKEEPYIAYPKEVLFDKNCDIVGVLMPYARGITLSIFMSQLLPHKKDDYYPNVTRKDLVSIAILLVQIFEKLHSYGIIVGDVNMENILIDIDPTGKEDPHVWLVDIDSAQLEEYPCLVDRPEYRAPWRSNNVMKKVEDDNYALAIIIFKLLMMNVDPYQQKGWTESFREKGFFPYALSKHTVIDCGPPRWAKEIWDISIPQSLKTIFYDHFSAKGSIFNLKADKCNNTLLDLKKLGWEKYLNEYKKSIISGKTPNELYFMSSF